MNRAVNRLAARGLTAYLLFAYAVFLVFLAIWGARVPAAVLNNISRLPPFAILYVTAGVHLVCCLVLFWPVVRQRTSLAVPADDPGLPLRATPAEVLAAAKSQGFRSRSLPGAVAAVLVRNRWSPAGTLAFHAALLLLPVAFFVSRATRFKGEAWIVEGHQFHGTRAEYTKVEPEDGFESRAPKLSFDVERVEAEFWGDRLFFTDLVGSIRIADEPRSRVIRLPQPVFVEGARVSLRGFNYTPAVEVRDPGGEILESADVSLWLFPPGTEDSFAIPGLPYRFWVRLYPDSGGPESRPVNEGHDLKRPLFHVAVTAGKRLVTHGWLRIGEPLSFDGYRISLPMVRKGGEIVIHRDLGYPILWVALAIALAGSVARIAFPASHIWILGDGDGAHVIVREDLFARGRAARLLAHWTGDAR